MMLSRLSLPPPHRLSRSNPSRPLHRPSATTTNATTNDIIEETDSAPPVAKRPRTLKAHAKPGRESKHRTTPTVRTFDGKPLKKISLFLPQCLPASVATDSGALASYTLSTTATYLRIWNLDKNMDSVDVRLPEEYSNLLQRPSQFLPKFLETVFRSLAESGVKSVKKFITPTLRLQHLTPILNAVKTLPFTVKNILVPLSTECTHSDLTFSVVSEIPKAASAVAASTEITLVSSCPDLGKILEEIRTGCGKTSVRFSCLSNEEQTSSIPGIWLYGLEWG